MLVPHLNLGHREKKLSAARKFMKLTMLRFAGGFPQFLLSSILIKKSSFYVKNSKFEMPIKENVLGGGR